MTLRFLTTSVMGTIARYVEITTIHGTSKMVKKNSILNNSKYFAINASVKSIFETIVFVVAFNSFVDVSVIVSVNCIQSSTGK